ncbi:MAG: prenyltransferase [Anaerolineales bacterium]
MTINHLTIITPLTHPTAGEYYSPPLGGGVNAFSMSGPYSAFSNLIQTPYILAAWQAFPHIQAISCVVLIVADQNYPYTYRVMTKLFKVARLQFLVVGLALFVFGALWAVLLGSYFSPERFLFGYLIILPAQLSVHFSNDYFDISSDKPGGGTLISGGGGVLIEHPELRKPALWIAITLILVSIGVGIAFMRTYSYPFWMMGFVLLGNLAGWSYSAPPMSLSQRGWGELCYTFISGLLIPGMGYLVGRGALDLNGFFFAIPLTLYGLVSILSVEIPDMEDDRISRKRTWVAQKGRNFGFTLIGWLLIAATTYFFIYPIFNKHHIPIDLRVLGFFSLLPLGAGIFGMVKRTRTRESATRIATWIVILLAVFSILVDGYLLWMAGH